ncbi:type II toxin-antitoxin system HigB family toxin [Pedobacter heparinus]|uniref:type II toxin-antitoxin system HigB family toxin n=1 Tax=Pedobacter heparinus TaxID=984 RepID=UPI00292F5A55|nr:type II toxin-antitoxin system HigB family toxin [Pedobacter heparinus]
MVPGFPEQSFKNPQALKKVYGNASIIANQRVVFNIMGNKYRLVVMINYEAAVCYVIWFGSHAEYDRINVEIVKFEDKEQKQ